MADAKISALTALTGANTASTDLFPLVDVSDTTMAASGTTKKTTRADLQTYVGGTVTADTPTLNLTQTWNNGAITFTGIKANITNTASAAASKLMDLQVGGTSMASISRIGLLSLGDASVNAGLVIGGQNALYWSGAQLTYQQHLIFPSAGNYDVGQSGGECRTVFSQKYTATTGTITADTPMFNGTQTWNNGAVTFTGIKANFTDTASANASMPLDIQMSGTSVLKLEKSNATTGGTALVITAETPNTQTVIITPRDGSTGSCSFRGAGSYYFDAPVGIGNQDTAIARASANSFVFGTSPSAGAATTRTEIAKSVTAIANNSATAVLTFTVPNAAHSASFLVELVGSSGAGGSVGANESTQSARYQVDITRTAGVNAVASIGAVFGQPAAVTVTGGNSVATTAALSAISGAVGATNTFTVNVTIARSAGTATNHTCLVNARLLNANASGVTVA